MKPRPRGGIHAARRRPRQNRARRMPAAKRQCPAIIAPAPAAPTSFSQVRLSRRRAGGSGAMSGGSRSDIDATRSAAPRADRLAPRGAPADSRRRLDTDQHDERGRNQRQGVGGGRARRAGRSQPARRRAPRARPTTMPTNHERHRFAHHQTQHVAALRAERHADADFVRAPRDAARHQPEAGRSRRCSMASAPNIA